ncbi:hypothetical protein CHS0354_010325 [Potamilus streckersoni]|uniref:Ubiquitin carboxyl-terminal hydrolase n=1 Tax=Potamilus streckersoni TaxID=2493646 RepID=A0AAE0TEH2_9BIVA|nr:hypothetical protein CHS0354_010325 [Potamilus streckersoni]
MDTTEDISEGNSTDRGGINSNNVNPPERAVENSVQATCASSGDLNKNDNDPRLDSKIVKNGDNKMDSTDQSEVRSFHPKGVTVLAPQSKGEDMGSGKDSDSESVIADDGTEEQKEECSKSSSDRLNGGSTEGSSQAESFDFDTLGSEFSKDSDISKDSQMELHDQQLRVELPSEEGAAGSSLTGTDRRENTQTSSDPSQSVYHIKWITFKNKSVPIITQNENGPCPLLAVLNVLLLQGRIMFAPNTELITSAQLMTYLGDCILQNIPGSMAASEFTQLNFEQNMSDAMTVMHKLQTGLDVNVRFTGVRDFEYTPECIIFDLLQISLYHGWLVDPQNEAEVSAMGTCSYNQLVEKIITQKGTDDSDKVNEALIAEQFLETSASQLTYFGLSELTSTVKNDELCVFFRNNHFSTLYRHQNELFLLVTDQGYITESSVVWETLSSVEGDCHFVDHDFRTYTKPIMESIPPSNVQDDDTDEHLDPDYLVALSLQEEQQFSDQQLTWEQRKQQQEQMQLSDAELARRLQEEENRIAAAARGNQQQQQQQQNYPRNPQQVQGQGHEHSPRRPRERVEEKNKKSDCCIL